MRPTRFTDREVTQINWQVIKMLVPYIMEFKVRIGFALLCL